MDKYYTTDMDGNVLSVDDIVIYAQNNRGLGRGKIVEINDSGIKHYEILKLQISKNRYCDRCCKSVLLDKEA